MNTRRRAAGRAVLIGLGATATMDLGGEAIRRATGVAPLDYALVGRWIGHMAQGQFAHANVRVAAPVPEEKRLGLVALLHRHRFGEPATRGPPGMGRSTNSCAGHGHGPRFHGRVLRPHATGVRDGRRGVEEARPDHRPAAEHPCPRDLRTRPLLLRPRTGATPRPRLTRRLGARSRVGLARNTRSPLLAVPGRGEDPALPLVRRRVGIGCPIVGNGIVGLSAGDGTHGHGGSRCGGGGCAREQ
jgi:hypothetical protein